MTSFKWNLKCTYSAEAHKTLVVYILASVILICGISLGLAGSFGGRFYLILGAFFDTAAGELRRSGLQSIQCR